MTVWEDFTYPLHAKNPDGLPNFPHKEVGRFGYDGHVSVLEKIFFLRKEKGQM